MGHDIDGLAVGPLAWIAPSEDTNLEELRFSPQFAIYWGPVVQINAGSKIRFRDDGPEIEDFRSAVISGLRCMPKTLPCKFFYDKTGSELFDQICSLEEYYPTRTELALLQKNGPEFAEIIGENCHVIEFGSGSSIKIQLLLASLDRPSVYTAIDISREHLIQAADAVAEAFPDVEVEAICADYTNGLDLEAPSSGSSGRRVGFFPGSTIGNFTPDEANAFLVLIARTLGTGAVLLIGVDLKKDEDILIGAYNDREGVTAAFNQNLLVRINHELSGDFDLSAFRHEAIYNRALGRIEMHLISESAQSVHVNGHCFEFASGETIHTENSHKFTIEEFRAMALMAGFDPIAVWADPEALFSVHLLAVS